MILVVNSPLAQYEWVPAAGVLPWGRVIHPKHRGNGGNGIFQVQSLF